MQLNIENLGQQRLEKQFQYRRNTDRTIRHQLIRLKNRRQNRRLVSKKVGGRNTLRNSLNVI